MEEKVSQKIFLFVPTSFFLKINLFLAALGLRSCAVFLQLRRVGATLCFGARASHCGGFSCCRACALGTRASVVVARRLSSCGSRALERRLSSCGALAQLLCGMWDLPGPGLEHVSPALAGGFLTTAPSGKPCTYILIVITLNESLDGSVQVVSLLLTIFIYLCSLVVWP